MPNVGLVVVEKTFAGEPFLNTYALQHGIFNAAPLNNVDLTAFRGGGITGFNSLNTNPTHEDYAGEDSPLACILAFDRMMTYAGVGYTRLYVSDGKTAGEPTGAFATFPLAFGGLSLLALGEDDIAPLNIALQINRVPASFSQRAGRIQFRAALATNEVKVYARKGCTIKPASRAAVQGRLDAAIATSQIFPELILPDGSGDVVHLVIPKYDDEEGPSKGAIIGAADIGALLLADAVSRQVPRGRKESTGP